MTWIPDVMWVVIVMVAVTAVLLLPARRREAREARRVVPGKDHSPEIRDRSERLLAEVGKLEVELERLHREVTARTDNKLAMLRQLIADAEARIAELQELLQEADS